MALEVGSVIQNKYRILRLIGEGGMGAVYEGENQAIARRVAIKVLHGSLANQSGVVERFEREAQAAGRIGNDHILEVLDLGSLPSGDRFMVMEFLDGETLEDRVERLGVLSPQQAYPLVRQLLLGLAAAHTTGIVHRDLKPENVFILTQKAGNTDFVKIIDFGISKFASTTDPRMTATGAVMGTPYYMSPEQAKGSKDTDARSDLYSVGVILFRCVTGRVPFLGENFNELLFKIVLSDPPRVSELQPGIDEGFESIILRAMSRDPAVRFQTAEQFVAALDAWYAHGQGVSVPPPGRISAPAMGVFGDSGSQSGVTVSASQPELQGGTTNAEWAKSGFGSAGRSTIGLWLVLAGALLLGGGALVFLLLDDSAASDRALAGKPTLSNEPLPELTQTAQPVGDNQREPVASPTNTTASDGVSEAASDDVSKTKDGPATKSAADKLEAAELEAGEAEEESGEAVDTEEPESARPSRPTKRRKVRPPRKVSSPRPTPAPAPAPVQPPSRGGDPDFGY